MLSSSRRRRPVSLTSITTSLNSLTKSPVNALPARPQRQSNLCARRWSGDLPGRSILLAAQVRLPGAPELAVFLADPDGMVSSHLSDQAILDAEIFDFGSGAAVPSTPWREPRRTIFHPRQSGFRKVPSTQILHRRFVQCFEVATNQGVKNDVIVTYGTIQDPVRRPDERAPDGEGSDALFPLPLTPSEHLVLLDDYPAYPALLLPAPFQRPPSATFIKRAIGPQRYASSPC